VRLAKRLSALLILTTLVLLGAYAQEATQHGIDASHVDKSVRPGDDFYEYANGAWLKTLEIPADRGSVGVFNKLADLSNKRTNDLIQEIAKSNPAAGSENRKIADLFTSYMDEAGIEAKGMAPIKPHLDAVAAIKDKKQLAAALGRTLRQDVDPFNNTNFQTDNLFGLWVGPGLEEPFHYHAYLLQGGIELPDKAYYVDESDSMKQMRGKYAEHVAAMFKLAGFDNPEQRAKHVVDLETAIAKTHRGLDENEDIAKANNVWQMAGFSKKAPGLDWAAYFKAAGLGKQKSFYVYQPEAFTGEAALVQSQPLDAWKDWLSYHLLEHFGGILPKAFADERFAFFGTAMSGATKMRPRWQRGVGVVNGLLGDAVGKMYAERYFSPEAKKTAQEMVTNIKGAFHKRIEALEWMDPKTKAEAQKKLDSLYVGVGYPEKWRDYSKYEVKPDDIFGNLWRAETFDYQYWVGRLGTTVDKHEWSMTPQTVNAVNLPLQNALNFPAAILEPPFFDAQAPAAANYGAIGTVIGHEVSHTFDTLGSTFDADGRYRNWWTKSDLEHFKAATEALAKQYDAYAPFPDLHINGHQTLAENIADNAGIASAYDGYRAQLGGKEGPVQDGFSSDQQFFIAFAQNWAGKARDRALRAQVATDVHSPGHWRSFTVRNIDQWYKAFDVTPDQKLYLAPDQRVRIW
jgi:endothelin-converting enzyme/putative endopeptidase